MNKQEQFNALIESGTLPKGSKMRNFSDVVINNIFALQNSKKQAELEKEETEEALKVLGEAEFQRGVDSVTTLASEEVESAKTLSATTNEDAAEQIEDLVLIGVNKNPWRLLCKVYSKKEGWMKSTKAMACADGVLVQVTTQDNGEVAEALTYVPEAKLAQDKANKCWYLV